LTALVMETQYEVNRTGERNGKNYRTMNFVTYRSDVRNEIRIQSFDRKISWEVVTLNTEKNGGK
jgi:hypothetical protein